MMNRKLVIFLYIMHEITLTERNFVTKQAYGSIPNCTRLYCVQGYPGPQGERGYKGDRGGPGLDGRPGIPGASGRPADKGEKGKFILHKTILS